MRTRLMGVAAATAMFAVSAVASATTLLKMDIEDLATHADEVVLGTVEESRPAWNDDHTMIYTHTYVRVDQAIAGASQKDALLHVITVGGRIGEQEAYMAGNPSYEVGETVVVFLEERRKGPEQVRVEDHYLVTGLFQGKYRVTQQDGKTILTRPAHMDGATLVSKDDGIESFIVQVPLSELVERVQAVKEVQP